MPTISEELTRLSNNLDDAFTAITNKGGTLPANKNFDNLATAIGTVTSLNGETINITPSTSAQTITPTSPANGIIQANVSAVTASIDANIVAGNIKNGVSILGITGNYTGSGSSSGTRDVTLTRITDDNGNEIGTWYMNFEDGNGNIFKVVLLDAQYRLAQGQWCSDNTDLVSNMPLYVDLKTSNIWEAPETATTNTQLILDFCTEYGYTSTACSHCRSKSFTIEGVTYYGQLPNMVEVIYLAKHYNKFDQLDTSASTSTSTNFSLKRNIWSSSQYNIADSWRLDYDGQVRYQNKGSNSLTSPVLEIPVVSS